MIGMLIMIYVALAVFNALKSAGNTTQAGKDRAFATQKAIQMMEELRAFIEDPNSKKTIKTLDDFDNSPIYQDPTNVLRYVLTTRLELNDPLNPGDPGDPLSGNPNRKFVKHIEVEPLAQEANARKVRIRILSASTMEPLAEVASILRILSVENSPTQVYDLYLIAIENVPGWWISTQDLIPMFSNMIQDVMNRNPGLRIRTHWITRLSYGRDPFYAPYVNSAVRSDLLNAANMGVYYYPGNVGGFDGGANITKYYYVPQNLGGKYNLDGVIQTPSDFAYTGSLGGTMADQFNHAMRYPDEVAAYNAATTTALSQGLPIPEMSLRMFLEKMNSTPNVFQNALIVNLHGELIPVPPMRNYSDAAMRPETTALQYMRTVAHPQKLRYDSSPGEVDLRVYSYVTKMTAGGVLDDTAFPPGNAGGVMIPQTMILISSMTYGGTNDPTISVIKLVGNSGLSYQWQTATSGTDYTITQQASNVISIKINNSPVRHARYTTTNAGLDTTARLYGLEYIPSSVATTFGAFPGSFPGAIPGTLTDTVATNPKNTARWIIRIFPHDAAHPIANGMYTIKTRIGAAGDNLITNANIGSLTGWPYDDSRTYLWVGVEPPITERFQFTGDPRHMPYDDVKSKVMLNGILDYGTGYNRYFTNSGILTGYSGYGDAGSYWNSVANYDVPRFMQLYREGIMKSNAIWNTITGYSFYYLGLGGEMGYDSANKFSTSLQIKLTPWNPSSSAFGGVDEITSNSGGSPLPGWNPISQSNARLIQKSDGSWYGRYWLGELFPDNAYSVAGVNNDWQELGNLSVGTTGFKREKYSTVLGYTDVQKRLNRPGVGSFYNNYNQNASASSINHDFQDTGTQSNGDLTQAGNEVAQTFRFPLLNTVLAMRPFQITGTGGVAIQPPEANSAPYINTNGGFYFMRTTLNLLDNLYQTRGNSSEYSSAIVRFSTGAPGAPNINNSVGNAVINGLSPQSDTGTSYIGKMSLIGLLRGFMASGAPNPPGNTTLFLSSRVVQLPLIVSTSPAANDEIHDPTNIRIFWFTNWQRWDGQKYASSYPNTFSETVPLLYNIKISKDNGRSWIFPQDRSPAQEGVVDTNHLVTYGSPPNNYFDWNVSDTSFDTGYPQGPYIFRIECYRQGLPLHYSYHQLRVFIKRGS